MNAATRERVRLVIHGKVPGAAFGIFVTRLARGLGLVGWIEATSGAATIEVEGPGPHLDDFQWRLRAEGPPGTAIQVVEALDLPPCGDLVFEWRRDERQ